MEGERAYWRSVWQGWLGIAPQKVEPRVDPEENPSVEKEEDADQEDQEDVEGEEYFHKEDELGNWQQKYDLESYKEEGEVEFEDCQNMESGVWSLEYESQIEADKNRNVDNKLSKEAELQHDAPKSEIQEVGLGEDHNPSSGAFHQSERPVDYKVHQSDLQMGTADYQAEDKTLGLRSQPELDTQFHQDLVETKATMHQDDVFMMVEQHHGGLHLDHYNGQQLDKHGGLHLDKHDGHLDHQNGLQLDKHDGLNLDKHDGKLDNHGGQQKGSEIQWWELEDDLEQIDFPMGVYDLHDAHVHIPVILKKLHKLFLVLKNHFIGQKEISEVEVQGLPPNNVDHLQHRDFCRSHHCADPG